MAQLLDVPKHITPMDVSVSIKGVTFLKQGQYKKRHSGSKEILQQPQRGFILLKDYKRTHAHEYSTKRRPKKQKQLTESELQQKEQKRTIQCKRLYVIDKKQVSHRIHNYVNSMKGEKMLFLWTVTFPQKTTDETAYRLFNIWLTRLRTERMIKDYLWIAERQKNGTVHYHIAVNNRMDIKKANRFMRAAIMRSIDNGSIAWDRVDAAKYNGVDISKNRKTRRVTNFAKKKNQKALAHYLTKYVSKSQDKFPHLAWHNSRGYSNIIISFNLTAEEWSNTMLSQFADETKPLEGEFFLFLRWKGQPPDKVINYLAYVNSIIQSLAEEN